MLRLTDPLVLPLVSPPLRDAVTALWALDARCGELARAGREPALRQIRLAWWSEQLASLDPASVPAEPLLQSVAADLLPHLEGPALAALAEAWVEEALGDADSSARGGVLFGLTAQLLARVEARSADGAGRGWAAVNRALSEGRADWPAIAASLDAVRLSGLPRPLAAITAVARRIARHDGSRSASREQWLLFRVGLLGR